MSYDIEQAEKAIREKRLQDIINSLRLQQHKDSVENVTRYGLPYRVLWDREQNLTGRNVLEIDINPFYPLPRVPKQGELTADERINRVRERYSIDEWLNLITIPSETKQRIERVGVDKHRFALSCEPVNDEIVLQEFRAEQERINRMAAERAEQYKQWDLVTEQGIQAWERLFTRFIVPYKEKIPTWKAFDFWGNTEHTAEETEQKRAYYMGLIADYENNPHKYDTQPRYKQLQDYDLYNLCGNEGFNHIEGFTYGWVGYMWRDDFSESKPPEHPQALQIMYKERELEIQNLQRFKEDWEIKHEHTDRYSKLYRINQIIEQLEERGKQ